MEGFSPLEGKARVDLTVASAEVRRGRRDPVD